MEGRRPDGAVNGLDEVVRSYKPASGSVQYPHLNLYPHLHPGMRMKMRRGMMKVNRRRGRAEAPRYEAILPLQKLLLCRAPRLEPLGSRHLHRGGMNDFIRVRFKILGVGTDRRAVRRSLILHCGRPGGPSLPIFEYSARLKGIFIRSLTETRGRRPREQFVGFLISHAYQSAAFPEVRNPPVQYSWSGDQEYCTQG